MFVKLNYKKGSIETVYDCFKVTYIPNKIEVDPLLLTGNLILDISKYHDVTIPIDCNDPVEISYLNNKGKVIETKIFSI